MAPSCHLFAYSLQEWGGFFGLAMYLANTDMPGTSGTLVLLSVVLTGSNQGNALVHGRLLLGSVLALGLGGALCASGTLVPLECFF